jgi:hypothetical protein
MRERRLERLEFVGFEGTGILWTFDRQHEGRLSEDAEKVEAEEMLEAEAVEKIGLPAFEAGIPRVGQRFVRHEVVDANHQRPGAHLPRVVAVPSLGEEGLQIRIHAFGRRVEDRTLWSMMQHQRAIAVRRRGAVAKNGSPKLRPGGGLIDTRKRSLESVRVDHVRVAAK